MCPAVESAQAGDCPNCGMALERAIVATPAQQFTCPMHPEILQDEPGDCPICGMALEPVQVTEIEEDNSELIDMTRRFWVSLCFTVPFDPGSNCSWPVRSCCGARGHSSSVAGDHS